MTKMNPDNIVIIGSGNLATHLAIRLTKKGFSILQIISRNKTTGSKLAQVTHSEFTSDFKKINLKASIVLICVSDDGIAEVAKKIPKGNYCILHTSGGTDLAVLKKHHRNCGVLYPLQTFVSGQKVKWSSTPVFIEGSNKKNLELIASIGERLTKQVFQASSKQRLNIHLAAVISTNFTNHLFFLAEKLLKESKAGEFKILLPLINQSIKNIQHQSPFQTQTGPAKRGDKSTMEKHLKILNTDKSLREIYRILSESISRQYAKNGKH